MFPRALMARFPLLPMEEDGRLNDMPLREDFFERAFAYCRWTMTLDGEPMPGGLVPGLSAQDRQVPHGPQTDAYGAPGNSTRTGSPKHYTEMNRLVADAGKRDRGRFVAEYGAMLMEGLRVMGARGKHVNVL